MSTLVSNLNEFISALKEEKKEIELTQSMLIPYSIQLSKGTKIHGTRNKTVFIAFNSSEGISLEGDNKLENLSIQTMSNHRAIYIKSNEEDLGTIELNDLTVTGQVQLLTRAPHKVLKLKVDGLDIVSSDSRLGTEKPLAYGVTVYQGALTVYNYNQAKDSLIKADIQNVSIGRPNAPVIGTGIFIGGFGEDGGKVDLEYLHTNNIYSNGMIPFGQPTIITGGIFIVSGAHAKLIECEGAVTTYGVNDMVLDVWGEVDKWVCKDYIKSYGTSGIGFVNFGVVHDFVAEKPIETYGSGARGFNQYDGTIDKAQFDSIITYGDGSIGMQFSKPVGNIKILNDVITYGTTGESLVKGQIQELDAIAISLKPNGILKELNIGGNIETNGANILALSVEEDSQIESFNLNGNIQTASETNKAIDISEQSLLSEDVKNTINECVKS